MVEYTANEPCNPFELAEILPGAQRRLFDQSHLRHPGYTNFLTSGDAFIYKIDKQTSPQAVFDMVGEAIIGWTKSIQELKSSKQVSPAIRVSLAELARVSGFYVPYLSTLFKKEVGENISTYLLRLKIKTAQEMLLNTKLSTKEIGFYLNFSSQSYFIRCFKQLTGVTPHEFRKKEMAPRNASILRIQPGVARN